MDLSAGKRELLAGKSRGTVLHRAKGTKRNSQLVVLEPILS
jgi:hypothetical protein